MDVYIYSDESGVFDNVHYKTFVYAGLIFTDIQEMENIRRKFVGAEKNKHKKAIYKNLSELKAFCLRYDDKNDLYRIFKDIPKFGVVINQHKLDAKKVYHSSRTKQHYLDYAYVTAIKKVFEILVSKGNLQREDEISFHFFVDEHATANDKNYNLNEIILKELRDNTSLCTVPLFPNTNKITLEFCKSDTNPLIRGADIVANQLYSVFRPDSTNNRMITDEFTSIVFLPS
ncbi:MAG: DUF3800 domain-containing protein [Sphaerochaetaceae bacterium]|nr:DUF3800 domain-containing protein [Sphaerochaetaceae bacterium]